MTKREQVEQIEQRLIDQGLADKYDHPGIYSISIAGRLVYIGQSFNMLHRLAQHLWAIECQTTTPAHKYSIMRQATKGGFLLAFDVLYYAQEQEKNDAQKDELGFKEGELIRQYLPPLNYQIPSIDNYKSYTVQRSAKTISLSQILAGRD